jgi:hypothetical protein
MALEDFLRAWAAGIIGLLVDQVAAFEAAGGRIVDGSAGRSYALIGIQAYPVLCGDLVPWQTEDGPSDTRCGQRVTRHGQCEWHAAQMDWWRSLTEAEKAAQERREAEDEMAGLR